MTGTSPQRAAVIILSWIALSSTVIVYNAKILKTYPFPVTFTTLHLLFQTTVLHLLKHSGWAAPLFRPAPKASNDYALLPSADDATKSGPDGVRDSVDVPGTATPSLPMPVQTTSTPQAGAGELDWHTWFTRIVPPAAMFSASLILSNAAYLYLSIAFIHQLKSFSPVAIVIAAFVIGTKSFSARLLLIVSVISFGVCLSSYGEAHFNLIGFSLQAAAIAVEATRVTLIQVLLQGKLELTPLQSLTLFAPICLAVNSLLILPLEGFEALQALRQLNLLNVLLNCILTLALNLSAIYLIGLSAIILSLSKVVKDVLLVAGSTLFLGESLTPIQVVGYSVASAGLLWYKTSSL